MKIDILGDRVKAFEDQANDERFQPNAFIIARVDGRAFHTFTKGMKKPVDTWLLDAMIDATIAVASDLKSRLAYVQSDEATFCWHYPTQLLGELPFSGRKQKLCSVTAGVFTSAFITSLVRQSCDRFLDVTGKGLYPAFDCRIWAVPSHIDQLDAFLWREKDAVKNAVSTAASTIATARELAGLKHRERLDLLQQRGFDWEGLPSTYRNGAYVRRMSRVEELSQDTLAKIPAHVRPIQGSFVTRHYVQVDHQLTSVRQIYNAEGFFCQGAELQLGPLS